MQNETLQVYAIGESDRASYKLVSVNEAAKILCVHNMTVRRYIDEGKLIAIKISGVWLVHPKLK